MMLYNAIWGYIDGCMYNTVCITYTYTYTILLLLLLIIIIIYDL